MNVVVTCEHAGNVIPEPYQPLFEPYAPLLTTHLGYDIGALDLALDFAAVLGVPLFYSTTSRLLVDLNRSPGHPRMFSPATRRLPAPSRREVLERHYLPYREAVAARVAAAIEVGRNVVHLSCHTFTPVLDGEVRRADIGLMFDPRRDIESRVVAAWQSALRTADPHLRVRRNYPYRGIADGLTAYLRKRFTEPHYLGLQIEVNQKFPQGGGAGWTGLRRLLVQTFEHALLQPR